MQTSHNARQWGATAFVVGYNLAHHNGMLPPSLGSFGETRVSDWLDLATPVVVLGPLLWILARSNVPRTVWAIAAFGSYLYIEGHGIHLAANSISNVAEPGAPGSSAIHLWDEVIGHYFWYSGLALVVGAVLATWPASTRSRAGGVKHLLVAGASVITGITWATNGLEGGTVPLSLGCTAAALWYGWTRRGDQAPVLVAIAAASASVLLITWGIVYGGFAQPSSLA